MSFLPGWYPGVAGGVKTLTQALSTTTSGIGGSPIAALTAPGGILKGDILVMMERGRGNTFLVPAATPPGFTNLTSTGLDTDRQMISYKLALGTESGTDLSGLTHSEAMSVVRLLYVFRGDSEVFVITPSTPLTEMTAGDPASQNIAASGIATPLVAIAGFGCNATVTTRSFSPAADGEITNSSTNNFAYLDYKIYNSSPANITADMADFGAENALHSFYLRAA